MSCRPPSRGASSSSAPPRRVVDELRRRLGSTLQLSELADLYGAGTDWADAIAERRFAGTDDARTSWTPPSPATRARPPTAPAGACGMPARRAAARLRVEVVRDRARRRRGRRRRRRRLAVVVRGVRVAGAPDHDLVLLDGHRDGPVAGPVLGVDRVVLHGGVEPQPVALVAVVEGALERRCGCARAAAAAAAAARARAAGAGLASSSSLASGGARARRPASSSGSASSAAATERVVLGPQVGLLLDAAARRGRLGASACSAGTSSCSRLNASMSRTLTSSWWAIQASVRPWRTHVRIWLSCGLRDLRAMEAAKTTNRGMRPPFTMPA